MTWSRNSHYVIIVGDLELSLRGPSESSVSSPCVLKPPSIRTQNTFRVRSTCVYISVCLQLLHLRAYTSACQQYSCYPTPQNKEDRSSTTSRHPSSNPVHAARRGQRGALTFGDGRGGGGGGRLDVPAELPVAVVALAAAEEGAAGGRPQSDALRLVVALVHVLDTALRHTAASVSASAEGTAR